MKKIFTLIAALSATFTLAGCDLGGNYYDLQQANNTLHSYSVEQVDDAGLTLLPSDDMYVTFQQVSQFYQETEACTGLSAPGPTVEFISFTHFGIGGWGAYMEVSQTVMINTDEHSTVESVTWNRDARTDEQALKHEFIHHLLYMNGMGDLNANHDSPLFAKCGQGVNYST